MFVRKFDSEGIDFFWQTCLFFTSFRIGKKGRKLKMRNFTMKPEHISVHNRSILLELIRGQGPISRAEIARKTNLSAPSITRIVKDLMTEGLSMQGMSEIPLVVYLCSRPGPGTGVPTYTSQADLDVALRGGHGEFPRVVIAPGDPIECIEKTNEGFYLAEKFNTLSIILSDKHIAESEFSSDRKPNKILPINIHRKLPGQEVVKASSYEHDKFGNTTENALLTKQGAEKRIKKYNDIKQKCKNFEMIKIFGNKNAKNLVIGWGSTKTVILDALDSIDASIKKIGNYRFLQVLYMKPMSDEIGKEILKIQNAGGKVILIENNLTGQLGRLIREKTGISIKNRILKYDGRPFKSDELKGEILKIR